MRYFWTREGTALKRRLVQTASVLIAVVLLLAALYVEHLNTRYHLLSARTDTQNALNEARARLENQLLGNTQLVKGMVSVIAANPHLTQAEFVQAARPLIAGRSQIRNIAAAPDMVIRLMYPLQGNERAIGFDYRSVPQQFASADLARRSGQAVLAGPLELVQGGVGVIARVPVYLADNGGEPAFWGLISSVIDAERLYQESGLRDAALPIEIAIRGRDAQGESGETFFGRPQLFDADPALASLILPYGSWQLGAIPRGGWPTQPDNVWWLRGGFLLIGLLILGPLAALGRSLRIEEQGTRQLKRSHQLLESIRRAQEIMIANTTGRQVFEELLQALLQHTDSAYGFIGEVLADDSGAPYLRTHAITNIAWDARSQAMYEAAADAGLEFRNPDNLFGAVLKSGGPVIANDPSRDARAGGLPPGHPALHSFMGVPLYHEGVMIGMAGLANRPGGYDEALYRFLQPLLITCGTLIAACRYERTRQNAEEELRLAHAVYQHSSEAMAVTDAQNRILAINPAFTRMTGYTPEEVLGRNPSILRSSRQDEAFYRAMWEAIEATGQWQGEIWNRRKSGEEYVEWLSINTIYGEGGVPHRRVALFSDITEKKKADSLIWQQANYDALTQLPNRRLFTDRLAQEIRKSEREQRMLALLFIDLDHFKEVNDSMGHHVGDELLVEAAKRLENCVRRSDTVARLGGDEFTVILSELNAPSDIGRIAQDILDTLAEPFRLGDDLTYISASMGITLYPDDARSVAELLRNADQAMYAAKKEGRNRFSFFTRGMQEAAQLRMQLARDLRSALADKQFVVHYQPIVELHTRRVRKAEALLRWRHPQHGFISPALFIPIAEETGAIHGLGDWVFMQAAECLQRCQHKVGEEFQISINKSPVQFRDVNDVHSHWERILQEKGVPGSRIVVEITEGLLMSADSAVQKKLLHFRDIGIQVAIDDFGTGYSTLAYLKKFDIDYLKIDKSFTRNLAPDNEDMALCEAIVVMAHKLGLKVIAEGVETEEQCALLQQIGCDYGQGYLFAHPMPAEEFERRLAGQD